MSIEALFSARREDAEREAQLRLLAAYEVRIRPSHKVPKVGASPSRRVTAKRTRELSAEYPTIKLIERIDLGVLWRINEQKATLLPPHYQTQFNNFYANTLAANGERVVTYRQVQRESNIGRYHPIGGLALQNMLCELRATLVAHTCWQLDIRAAHHCILLWMARRHDIDTPALRHYTQHREAVLAEFGVPRDEAKTIMLAQMFGSPLSAQQHGQLPQFVVDFHEELARVAERMWTLHDNGVLRGVNIGDLVQRSRKRSRVAPKFVFLSHLLQDIEAQCLVSAVEFAQARGCHVNALLHDGLLLLKDARIAVDDAFIDALQAHIEQRTQVAGVKFELKSLGACLPLVV